MASRLQGMNLSSEFNSVAQLCPTSCDSIDCITPGFPVHHQLLELAQTHVHRVTDAIQPFILCHSLLFLPLIFPSVRVFSDESLICIRGPKYWSFSISPFSEYSGLISFRMAKGLSRVFSNTTVQKHQFFGTQLSLWSNFHIHT